MSSKSISMSFGRGYRSGRVRERTIRRKVYWTIWQEYKHRLVAQTEKIHCSFMQITMKVLKYNVDRSLRIAIDTLLLAETEVVGCSMSVALRLSARLRLLLKLDTVVVCATNSRGFADTSSLKEKRPRRRYFRSPEKIGDISALYSNSVVAESIPDLVKTCTKRINAYVELRNVSEAQSLFNLMIEKEVEPNVYTYTILMKGYTRVGHTEKVYELFEEMEKKGVEPSIVSFGTVIEAHAIDGDLEGAQARFEKMKNSHGLNPNVYTYSAMLNVCVSARDLETAKSLFDEMNSSGISPDTVAMSTMFDVYAECCNEENGKQYLEECRQLMQEMEGKQIKANRRTYNILLKLCSRGCLIDESIKILNEMEGNAMHPTIVSYNTVLDGISKDQNLSNEKVLELSSNIVNDMKEKEVQMNACIYNTLLNVALRVEDLDRSDQLFKEMKTLKIEPTLITYNTMMKCYEKLGDPKDGEVYLNPCLDLLEECEQEGKKMDAEGYASLLSACANASDFDQAMKIWNRAKEKEVKPNVSIYTAMIKACLSEDKDDLAFDFLDQMKTSGIKPNAATHEIFLSYFEEKNDRAGAEKICDEMKTLEVEPNENILRLLNALGIE